MSQCLKCGAPLPEVGDCTECHAPATSVAPKVPPLLEQEIHEGLGAAATMSRPKPPALPKARPPLSEPLPTLPTVPKGVPPAPPSPLRPSAPTPAASPIPPTAHGRVPLTREDADEAEAKTSIMSIPGWPVTGEAPTLEEQATPRESTMGPSAEDPTSPESGPVDDEDSLGPEHEPTQILAVPKRAPSIAPDPFELRAGPSTASNEEEDDDRSPAERPTPRRVPQPGEVYASVAPVWRRLVAGAIDFGAICTVASLYLAVALAVTGRKAPQTTLTGLDGWMVRLHGWQPVFSSGIVLTALLAAAYSVAFTVVWDGQTPGRKVMGLKLVDMTGAAPSPARAVKRALLGWLSAAMFLAGYWLMLFDRRRQSLHDKLTETLIVSPGFPAT